MSKLIVSLKGGPGSGHHGHTGGSGGPGNPGGSTSGGGGGMLTMSLPSASEFGKIGSPFFGWEKSGPSITKKRRGYEAKITPYDMRNGVWEASFRAGGKTFPEARKRGESLRMLARYSNKWLDENYLH
jgi:hypothetical protein